MLTRIRAALGHPSAASTPSALSLAELGPVMPEAGDDLAVKFEAELNQVGGGTYRASTVAEAQQVIARILDSSVSDPATDETTDRRVVLSRNPLLQQLGIPECLKRASRTVTIWPWDESQLFEVSEPSLGRSNEDEAGRQVFKEECFDATAGITGVDFALAESGTLVLSSATEGSQLTSLAPPVHIALYRRAQLVGSLEEMLERAARSNEGMLGRGRSIVLVTGTSRTADIEQILIRGVHGPRQIHAILVEDSCFSS
jgi:L-lactate utilization protein LutC